MFYSALDVEEVVLNHAIGVVTEKWFQGKDGNASMFVKPDFDIDIVSWFHY